MDPSAAATLSSLVATVAASEPERTALVCPDEHVDLTYGDLAARSSAAAAMLSNAGLSAGHKLAVMLPSGARHVTCLLGAASLDLTIVPIDPMFKGPDARDVLKASGARALVIDAKRLVELTGLIDECGTLEAVFVAGGTSAGVRFRDLDRELADRAGASVVGSPKRPESNAIEAYRFHTDRLEAVPRTHAALVADSVALAQRLSLNEGDRGICAIPLGHTDGVTALGAAIASGSRLIIPERFEARRFWEFVVTQRATWIALVPTQFLDLNFGGAPANGAHDSVRVAAVSGASVSAKMLEEFTVRFGITVVTALSTRQF
jgi:acyl-CoA synthetase (AMP-forming)/AMP-acid ligase II